MPIHLLFYRKWFFDEIYNAVFVSNAKRLGRLFWKGGDKAIIDGFGPDGMSALSRRIGGLLGKMQSGF
ncbi:MAG: NADH-quinone oxidoreductase subunit L, partial [Bdellovibrionales bacterium]